MRKQSRETRLSRPAFPATSATAGHETCDPPLLEMEQAPSTLDASAERHPLLSLISACFWVIRECSVRADGIRWAGLKESTPSVSLVVEMVQVARRFCHHLDTTLDLFNPLIFDDPNRELCSGQVPRPYLTIWHSSTFGLSR